MTIKLNEFEAEAIYWGLIRLQKDLTDNYTKQPKHYENREKLQDLITKFHGLTQVKKLPKIIPNL